MEYCQQHMNELHGNCVYTRTVLNCCRISLPWKKAHDRHILI
jgi:hypothetical protein